jgi:hypothetical protein
LSLRKKLSLSRLRQSGVSGTERAFLQKLSNTMSDIPVLGEVGSGSVIQLRENQPIHGITLGKIRINAATELAVAASRGVLAQ